MFETDFLIVVSNICILLAVMFLAVSLRKTTVGRYLVDWPVSRIPSTPISADNSFSAAKGTSAGKAGTQLPPLNLWKKLEQAETEGNMGMKKTLSSRSPHSYSSTPGTDYASTAGGSSTAGSPIKYWVEPKSPPGSPPSPSMGYWEAGYTDAHASGERQSPQRDALQGDALIKESCNDPALLIGWQIEVHGRGHGVIIGMKRTYSRPTKFLVQFENGQTKLLKLKRSDKKDGLAFSPIKKAHSM